VASVTHRKGHDVLVEALSTIADPPWSCVCAGAGELDRLRRLARERGVAERVRFAGPLASDALAAAYAGADLLVLPSRAETYGMVVTEALARGVPVLATAVGGVSEALGRAPDGDLPGILVPPGDVAALAAALRRWLGEPDLRGRLRAAARARRETLLGWDTTARAVAEALGRIA
jgi:glycosyltransferase involved in cell wall biosynthesis